MTDLAQMQCEACREEASPVSEEQALEYVRQLPEWKIVEEDGEKRLLRVYRMKNFAEALLFTDRVGALAEQVNHHPAILTEWGRVTVRWWTHKIRGLHATDFIMAARTDRLIAQGK